MIVRWDEVPGRDKTLLHHVKQIDCGSFYLTLHTYRPGWSDETHSHPEAQFGYTVEGEVELATERGERAQPAGDAYVLAGGVRHAARSSGGAVCLNLYVKAAE